MCIALENAISTVATVYAASFVQQERLLPFSHTKRKAVAAVIQLMACPLLPPSYAQNPQPPAPGPRSPVPVAWPSAYGLHRSLARSYAGSACLSLTSIDENIWERVSIKICKTQKR
jgi:hypothetical protein